jgi:hypothetical protein
MKDEMGVRSGIVGKELHFTFVYSVGGFFLCLDRYLYPLESHFYKKIPQVLEPERFL